MKDKLLKKTIKLLTSLEWASIEDGPRYGDSCEKVAVCPYCGGIDPEDSVAGAYSEVGHIKKCKLQELTRQIIKELTKK